MQSEIRAELFARRRLVTFALGGVFGAPALCSRIYAFALDFWNKKSPSDWSPEEVHQLLNKSPWAKQVTAEVAGSSQRAPGGSGGGGGRGGMGGGGRGMGGGGMGGGGGGARSMQQFKGVVRWESAKPVLDATKSALPEAFAEHYVIGVSGFPLGGRRRDSDDEDQAKVSDGALERIKAETTLIPKGKELAQAGVAQIVGNAVLLGFSKESIQLSADDKEVEFATTLGRLGIKAKFNFKEMMYHESLAL